MRSYSSFFTGLAFLFVATPILAQVTTPAPVVQKRNDDLTIGITNSYGMPLSLSFETNAGGPGFEGAPQPTMLPIDAVTSYAVPPGWAGRVYVGKTVNKDNSKIEGSWKGPGTGNIDVSYVDGYSVPITCSVGDRVIVGCNKELFNQPCQAPDTMSEMGPDGRPAVCHNAAQGLADGPASSFFAPCRAASYVFPNDNDADQGWSSQETEISCCVGVLCPPSVKQSAFKRDLGNPKAPSLMPRAQKLHERLNGPSPST